jgi:hypothetical protein
MIQREVVTDSTRFASEFLKPARVPYDPEWVGPRCEASPELKTVALVNVSVGVGPTVPLQTIDDRRVPLPDEDVERIVPAIDNAINRYELRRVGERQPRLEGFYLRHSSPAQPTALEHRQHQETERQSGRDERARGTSPSGEREDGAVTTGSGQCLQQLVGRRALASWSHTSIDVSGALRRTTEPQNEHGFTIRRPRPWRGRLGQRRRRALE